MAGGAAAAGVRDGRRLSAGDVFPPRAVAAAPPTDGGCLPWQRVVDFYHAALYVQQLADALFGDTKAGRQWARRMRRRLKEKDGLERLLQAATYHRQMRRLSAKRASAFEKAYG